MSDRLFFGPIHKIIAGTNPKDGVACVIGQSVDRSHPNIIVSSIILDEYLYEKHGQVSCVVWAVDKSKNDNIEKIYKVFIGVPLTIASDI